MKYIFYVIIFLLAHVPCQSQDTYKFRLIDVSNGLSDDQIRSLSMTADGRLAVRTASILNIYNGATFIHYPYDKERKYNWNYTRPPKEYYDNEGRMWMKELNYLLLLDLRTNEFKYDIQGVLQSMGISQKIKDLFIDDNKNYWFVTDDNSVILYDVARKQKIDIESGNSNFTKCYGVPVEMAQYKNQCWIVYSNGLVRCWDYASGEFIYQDSRFVSVINNFTDRIYLRPDAEGNIWLMYNNGVYFFNRTGRNWDEVADIKGLSNFFTCMDIARDGTVWVGTSKSGLRTISPKDFKVNTIQKIDLSDGGILDNDIHTIFIDHNNGVWVGTLFQGLCYYHPSMRMFQEGHTSPLKHSFITNESTRCFLEEGQGNILIGNRDGIYRFNPVTRHSERLFPSQINDLCMTLYKDSKNRIWAGTFLNGFYRIDRQGVKRFIRSSVNLEQDPNQNVSRAIYEDEQGNLWVSVTNGVGLMDPENGKILYMLHDKHPELKKHNLIYSLQFYKPNTFIACGDKGAFYYNIEKDSVSAWKAGTLNGKSYASNIKVYYMLRDSRGLEWYATEDGAYIKDACDRLVGVLTTEDGLPNSSVSGIVEDNYGTVWLSTIGGICKVTSEENNGCFSFQVIAYDGADGVIRGKFYETAFLKAKDGTIYFGGAHGFNYFDPRDIVPGKNNNTPVFTNFYIFNSAIDVNKPYGKDTVWTCNGKQNTIRLKHDQNFVSIEFSGLNYINPSHTYYKYKLLNFDKNWTEIASNGIGRASYTGLKPGKYKFVLYSANSDKMWSESCAEMSIIVAPPFWATGYAIAFYVILFLISAVLAFRMFQRKSRIKATALKKETEQKQKEELDQMKFRFFTNISHEFRTPLTLIITPLGALMKQELNEETKKQLSFIYQNANRLLKLVNQLLDFRKLEMKGEKLHLKMGNIVEFAEEQYNQFKEYADNEGVAFEFIACTEHLFMNFDQDKVYKILSNLLSNAFKFTPRNGYVLLKVERISENGHEYCSISVKDTGCGIAPEDIKLVFDRFYQTKKETGFKQNNGSGIGLHLVKEYVRLHNGDVRVESELGKGTTFNILIPTDLKNEDEAESQNSEQLEEQEPEPQVAGLGSSQQDEQRTILIVEDNEDFRMFLAGQLKKQFNVLQACDGNEGEKLAFEYYPDMIISDMMMPGMDGIELCHRVKNNIKTSHIPFILLTARSSDDVRMEGYKAGADSYISKPFDLDLLLIRINNLIEQQEKRKELFNKTIEVTPSSITTTSLDEELVKKALKCVEENIGNSEYTIEDLGRDIGLSKTHLNRKLQSITNLTPLQFIRSIRLKRAAQLLQRSQYNINEISEMVGFNTLKYFNKYFKEQFHKTPTQYREEFRAGQLAEDDEKEQCDGKNPT